MPRPLLTVSAAALLVGVLAGCTAAPAPSGASSPAPESTSAPAPSGGGSSRLPACSSVTETLGALIDGLTINTDLSASQEAQEEYDQRVCVFTTDDAATQLGVTIAAIPFQQGELDSFATLPNALTDPRLEQHGGVLQTFTLGDGDDGHLDSALYLFDTEYSVTIQGFATSGSTLATLPALTLPAATDAAFAVRALVG